MTPPAPSTASAAATGGPNLLALAGIALVGLTIGWLVARFASGARTRSEFVPQSRTVDLAAQKLASRFGHYVFDEEASLATRRRVVLNALATVGILVVLLGFVEFLTASSFKLLVEALLFVGILLESAEALVAYGAADEPLGIIDTNP